MFDELSLHGDHIYPYSISDDKEVYVEIRLPWYRSLPMEIIRKIEITIDDVYYGSEDLTVLVEGEKIPVSVFETEKRFWKIIWRNLDTQKVIIPLKQPLTQGEHTVKYGFTMDLPYVPKDSPEPPFIQYVETTKTMIYEKEAF